jgi:ATP/maltotriose-dependent transcriptional regulator MalT
MTDQLGAAAGVAMLPGPGQPAAAARWPLVGRREELELFAAALADEASQGFLIWGPAGVGKTRLAEDCLAAAAAQGRTVARATATAEAARMPLGTLMHVLPREGADSLTEPADLVVDRIVAAARHRTGEQALVLMVDELHLLDATSTVLLGQLINARAVFLIGTMPLGAAVPDVVTGWWRSGQVARVDLTDLPFPAVDTLLHLALGGPVAAEVIATAWTASRGNVLYLRELILGALGAGALVAEAEVWRLRGPLGTTPRLVDLVRARLATVDPAARPALDLLALADTVSVSDLASLVGLPMLETLERAGLIDIGVEQRREQVRLAHPLYSVALRAQLPTLTRRRVLLEHVTRIERHGARRREDALRIAIWRLEATETADPALLLRAARLARHAHDLPQVERLARAALAHGPSADAQLLLGEALYELGSVAEAEEVLAAAQRAARNEQQLVQVIAVRVANLSRGLLRADDALEVVGQARQRPLSASGRHELVAAEALSLIFAGRPATALRLIDEHLADPGLGRTRALRALAEAPALTLSGRSQTALAVAKQGFADHSQLADEIAIAHPHVQIASQAFALLESGQLTEAHELAGAGYQAAIHEPGRITRILFADVLGRGALLAGQPRTARRWFAEELGLCRDFGYDGWRRMALSGLTLAAAWVGDVPAAKAALAELDQLPEVGLLHVDTELGRAAALAATGDPATARARLLAAADWAASRGAVAWEARLRHDVARLGDPAAVRDRLAELAARCEGALVPAYALYAQAASAGDAAGLVEAADQFEAIGAVLYAAEAATAAATACQRQGERRRAAALRARAASLAQQCEGARTFGLVATDSVVPLTRREREVALLAVPGLSSREIAARLFLSVRTVDNHLQNAYAKLGVARRDQLAGALQTC